jgi:hypothetical protein|tara:strand:+ start:1667 stop:2371 length:705 start_codon:yes stop_codon:yes gene_type:complete
MLTEDYFHSILDLQNFCRQEEIGLNVQTLGQESLVTRARNTLVANFLDNESFTHLLFIDADIGFDAKSLKRFLEYDKDVMCAPYPMKLISWDMIPKLIEEKKDYRNLCHPYVLNFSNKGEINVEKGFAEVLDAATGFMLIKRECLLKMKEEYPDLRYKTDQIINNKEFESENTYLFFDTMKDDDERYLSEDYAFSRRWQKIGGKIYADIGSKITHFGSYRYTGELWKHFDYPKS